MFLKNYSPEYLFYLMFNTFRLTLHQIQFSFSTLFLTEKNRLVNISTTLNIIFYIGVTIIGIFGSLAFLMIYPLHSQLSNIWSEFYSKIKKNSLNLKKSLSLRISNYYNSEDNLSHLNTRTSANISLEFHFFQHYFIRLSAVLIIGAVLYFISVFVYFSEVQYLMLCRLDFAESMLNRRVFVYQRTIFLTELFADYKGIGLVSMYGYSSLPPSKIGYVIMADKMAASRRDIFQKNVQRVMQANVWDKTFAKIEDEKGFLNLGLSSGYVDIKWESLFLSTNYKKCNYSCYTLLFQELKEMLGFYNRNVNDTDKSSSVYLEEYYKTLLYFIIASLIVSIFIIFGYIIPYFNKEQEIAKFLQISHNINENDADEMCANTFILRK